MDWFRRDLRALFAVVCLALAVTLASAAAPARADDATADAAGAAVRAVITAQLEAFRRDDALGAYAFAAPGIKALFPSPESFMRMVRAQYRPVYRSGFVEFRDSVGHGDEYVQQVYIVGEDGTAVIATYTLAEAPEAGWLITGCVLTTPTIADQPI